MDAWCPEPECNAVSGHSKLLISMVFLATEKRVYHSVYHRMYHGRGIPRASASVATPSSQLRSIVWSHGSFGPDRGTLSIFQKREFLARSNKGVAVLQ